MKTAREICASNLLTGAYIHACIEDIPKQINNGLCEETSEENSLLSFTSQAAVVLAISAGLTLLLLADGKVQVHQNHLIVPWSLSFLSMFHPPVTSLVFTTMLTALLHCASPRPLLQHVQHLTSTLTAHVAKVALFTPAPRCTTGAKPVKCQWYDVMALCKARGMRSLCHCSLVHSKALAVDSRSPAAMRMHTLLPRLP